MGNGESRVAASTQRQALNALVFLVREVAKREIGAFGDYHRASGRKRIPDVLSRDQVNHLFAQLDGRRLLMTRLQYGAGLRVSELVHLRVKDVDVNRGQVGVRHRENTATR